MKQGKRKNTRERSENLLQRRRAYSGKQAPPFTHSLPFSSYTFLICFLVVKKTLKTARNIGSQDKQTLLTTPSLETAKVNQSSMLSSQRTSGTKKGGWIRKTPEKPKSKIESPSSQARNLVEKKDSYSAELRARAEGINNLCAAASTLRALAIKVGSGSFQESDLASVQTPDVLYIARDGCESGIKFVQDTLLDLKPLIISLYRDKLKAERALDEVEEAIQVQSLSDDEHEKVPPHPGLNSTRLLEFTSVVDAEEEV